MKVFVTRVWDRGENVMGDTRYEIEMSYDISIDGVLNTGTVTLQIDHLDIYAIARTLLETTEKEIREKMIFTNGINAALQIEESRMRALKDAKVSRGV